MIPPETAHFWTAFGALLLLILTGLLVTWLESWPEKPTSIHIQSILRKL